MFLKPGFNQGPHIVLIPISNWPNPCQFCDKVHLGACYLVSQKKAIVHRNKLAKSE